MHHLGCHEQLAECLTRIVRIAVILSMRRQDDVLPALDLSVNENTLTLTFDGDWLKYHPLMASELQLETKLQAKAGWKLIVK